MAGPPLEVQTAEWPAWSKHTQPTVSSLLCEGALYFPKDSAGTEAMPCVLQKSIAASPPNILCGMCKFRYYIG